MEQQTSETRIIHRYESPLRIPWKITNPSIWKELVSVATQQGKLLTDPPTAFRGGDIISPASTELAPSYAKFLSYDRPFAIIPVTSEPGGKITDVVHFPTKNETFRFDANLAAYKQHVADYVYTHWNAKTDGPPPLTQVTNVTKLPDGRYVTTDRYRGYLRGLGKGSGTLGIHELDTQRISIDELRHIVRALDATHPNADNFFTWLKEQNRTLPPESILHPDNPKTALRGQEWWIDPNAPMDRLRELTAKVKAMEPSFRALDPNFQAAEALDQMIKNNIKIFPHTNGVMDPDGIMAEHVVVHGTLYPDNIQLSQDREGKTSGMTVMGGDRSHIGLRGEMVDWLISSCAESPAHQKAIIDEFIQLHPSSIEKRGLAMHVLYRSLMEAPWFMKQKPEAYATLTKLSYDILKGNGVWKDTNTLIEAGTVAK